MIFHQAYKESAALYAFSAAGVAHAVARACAAGRLRKCHCAEADNEVETRQTWRWGGCGDNLAYGRAFALKFLDASPSSKRPNNVKIETRLDTRNADQKSNKKKKASCFSSDGENRLCLMPQSTVADFSHRSRNRESKRKWKLYRELCGGEDVR